MLYFHKISEYRNVQLATDFQAVIYLYITYPTCKQYRKI